MFSLVISIIAIAMVVFLAMSTLYFGGNAYNEGIKNAQKNIPDKQLIVEQSLPVAKTPVLDVVKVQPKQEIIYNNTYDFSGFIEFLPYILAVLVVFYIFKKVNFSLIHQIFSTRMTIKKANKMIKVNSNKNDKLKLLNIIERKLSYNDVYLDTVNSVSLTVLNKELLMVRDVFKNDLI